MAFPKSFLRMVVSGTLYTTETFSWGLSFITGDAVFDAPDEVPPALITAVSTYHAAPSMICRYAELELIKLNLINTDGRYANQTTVQHEFNPRIPGTGQAVVPPQIALAVSLRTDFRRGLAHAGRYYLPVPGEGINSSGVLPPNTQNFYLDRACDFVEAANAALGPSWRAGVVSDIGNGAQHAVTSLRVGRVLDTIRSRRTALDEDYHEQTIN